MHPIARRQADMGEGVEPAPPSFLTAKAKASRSPSPPDLLPSIARIPLLCCGVYFAGWDPQDESRSPAPAPMQHQGARSQPRGEAVWLGDGHRRQSEEGPRQLHVRGMKSSFEGDLRRARSEP